MLLAAEDITATRGSFRLHVDALHVRRGEVLAVIGPNGAGKSTLFRILALVDEARTGTIALDGRIVRPGDAAARRSIAAVFQRPHLFAGSVADNLRVGLRARRVAAADAAARIEAVLDGFGIADLARADVRRLSGGEAQRVAIARALVLEPDLLLLDEPAAALDAFVRAQLLRDLERLARGRGRGIILITHDPREAFALADRIAILEHGSIRQVGTPEDLVVAPATAYTAALTGAELLLHGTAGRTDGDFMAVVLPGGARMVVTAPRDGSVAEGDAVDVAYRPEDVVLGAAGAFERTTMLNRLALRVSEVRSAAGGMVRVRLAGPPDIVAVISRYSSEQLPVRESAELDVALKATALHAFRAAPRR